MPLTGCLSLGQRLVVALNVLEVEIKIKIETG